MAKKVFVTGNYLYIEDTITGALISGRTTSFEFIRNDATSEDYKVLLNGFPHIDKISISEMIDGSSVPYNSATFETFKEAT